MSLDSPLDTNTLEKMKACERAEFPICLSYTLTRIFGQDGKKMVDDLVMDETFKNKSINSPRDIWELYELYLNRASNILGADVSKEIDYESVQDMKNMLCTRCPLFEKHSKK